MSSYSDAVLADSPALYWRLGSGGTTDQSGNGRNGTGGGGITIGGVTPGAISSDSAEAATDFDGVDDRVVATGYTPFAAGTITFEGWCKRDTSASGHTLIAGAGAVANAPFISMTAAQGVRWVPDAALAGTTFAAVWPGNDLWVHWVLVAVVGTNATLYINGQSMGTQAVVAGFTSPGNFQAGATSSTFTQPLDGKLDELAVYSGALSFGRIQAHYLAAQNTPGFGRILEKPPLRLMYDITTPDGWHTRWADDERKNPANVPAGVTFGDAMPGGFDTFTATLPRLPEVDYPDLARFSNIRALGIGSQVAGEYRLTGSPRVSGDQMTISPEAEGWQAHLEDNGDAILLGVDRDLSHWTDPSAQRYINAYPNIRIQQGGAWEVNSQDAGATTPSIIQKFDHLNAAAALPWPMIETWYYAGGVAIGEIRYDKTAALGQPGGGVAWNTLAGLSTDDLATTVDASADHDDTTVTNQVVTATASNRKYAWLQTIYTATIAATDGSWASVWKNLRLFGYGVTRRGTSPDDGIYASDVIQLALTTFAPKVDFTTGSGGSIDATSLVIPQAAWIERTTTGAIVRDVDRFHLWDWAVWNGPDKPRFHYHPRGNYGRRWRARVAPSELQETGPSTERVFNGVIVQYQDVDGTDRTVGPTGSLAKTTSDLLIDSTQTNPANEAGLKRWAVLDMNGVGTAATATEVGRRFLQEALALDKSGSATITGWIYDNCGVAWPYWAVRSGDLIAFTDAADTSYRRIVRTQKNPDNRSVDIDLDAPPDGMDALLERLGVGLTNIVIG